ncbi:hypothetical protein AB6A40_006077 [Gnathostoma spinigerum]|uniref:Adenylosuccinate lyase n=1 Tax=Gnathostoma spinigerum TaxID=75299 RepID=A0ABD6EHI4_9BILA
MKIILVKGKEGLLKFPVPGRFILESRNAPSALIETLNTLGDQGLERTLDDSAIRRITIPDCFLTADAILTTLQNILEGLSVHLEAIHRTVSEELPFLALEKAMMLLTEEGVDRQEAHRKIREVALAAKELQKTIPISCEHILSDAFFEKVRLHVLQLVQEPLRFTGRCVSQKAG